MKIQLYDTTLRDGSQAEEIDFSLHDKVLIAQRLDEMGFDYIEGGYPASNPKDAEFFRAVSEVELSHAKIAAFGMTRRKGVTAQEDVGLATLLECGAPVITLVGKASAYQAREILRVSKEENLAMVAESVAFLAQQREVIFDAEHFFDGYKDDAEYAMEVLDAAVRSGATALGLCDTNGGSLPHEIEEITRAVVQKFDGVTVGIHCHNDCALAVANSLVAVRAGATMVQGTINGFGERCGNACLITLAANLGLKMPDCEVLHKGKIEHLTDLSRYIYELVNMPYPTHQPFVGKSAFAHKGGMHVSAIARDTASYEHVSPEAVGNERRILVSELSGRSNIKALTAGLGLEDDPALLDKILKRVVELENEGYQFEQADASFELLVRKAAGKYRPHFELLKFHVNTSTDLVHRILTEGTVKIRIADEMLYTVAEADGPVGALDAALRKALLPHFPQLEKMRLVDYKVRVINSAAATAARVRVLIESQDDQVSWGTVGCSENIIEASWIALIDSIEYFLCKNL